MLTSTLGYKWHYRQIFNLQSSINQVPQKQKSQQTHRPLADAMRPQTLGQVIGQGHVLGATGSLTRIIKAGHIPSLLLWGPPGCGKTTIARLIAVETNCYFDIVSAVMSGASELRKIFTEAKERLQTGQKTLLMVDEIHRFNRAQQDLFLPYVEDGTVILIGATTENPSFEVNSALLSRCKVIALKRLDADALLQILKRSEEFTGKNLPLDDDGKAALCNMADGDGRYLLNLCEELFSVIKNQESKEGNTLIIDSCLSIAELSTFLQKRMPVYDKHQDSHYNVISALHKSLRGSDVDAALYWFSRILAGGEDPLYIARRLVRFAVEDIGIADPNAIVQANAAKEAYDFLGSPEGELAIAQAVIYLATAPKSNAVYVAFKDSARDAKENGSLMPPKHILNAPTKFMKNEGYGAGYVYDHNTASGFSGQNYFPDDMRRKQYYNPVERGFEREVIKRLKYWEKMRQKK
jgi:putative ATPase